jgi:hypothetical protein
MLNFGHTEAFARAVHNPFEGLGQGFAQQQPTGFADGRQAYVSPLLRTVVPQLSHKGAVRQDDKMHVPCLAHAEASLTLAHPVLLSDIVALPIFC